MDTPISFQQFERDLLASKEIRAKVSDIIFARELYAALCNTDLYYRDCDTPVSCSWRHAGGVVADLRDQNEDYLDFYCSGHEGQVTVAVETALAVIGWRAVTPKDYFFSGLPATD